MSIETMTSLMTERLDRLSALLFLSIRNKFAKAAHRPRNAACPVDKFYQVAPAFLAAKLLCDQNIMVIGKAGAPAAQSVFIHKPARDTVEENIVADADDITAVEIADAIHSFTRDLAGKFLGQANRLFIG